MVPCFCDITWHVCMQLKKSNNKARIFLPHEVIWCKETYGILVGKKDNDNLSCNKLMVNHDV